jgi:hypothetical protein
MGVVVEAEVEVVVGDEEEEEEEEEGGGGGGGTRSSASRLPGTGASTVRKTPLIALVSPAVSEVRRASVLGACLST